MGFTQGFFKFQGRRSLVGGFVFVMCYSLDDFFKLGIYCYCARFSCNVFFGDFQR